MMYQSFFTQELERLRHEKRYRTFLNLERCVGEFPYAISGDSKQKITVWCSNDYLGMGQHSQVRKVMIETLKRSGTGSGGTRNISGNTYSHVALEKTLSDFHQKEASLVFTSGYVANETTLATLGSCLPECVFLSDEKNHASIIHGIRNSRAQKKIFRHNDVSHLKELLSSTPLHQPKIIVFESVYSMDGDVSPMREICALAKQYNALTYLDEVHSAGLYGSQGGGMAQDLGTSNDIDIIQGTLGKAFGLIGGYISGTKELIDFIRSFAPGFIFTTSLPPAIVAGALVSINYLKNNAQPRKQHQFNTNYLKKKLEEHGLPYLRNESHIVPLIVGNAQKCKEVTDRLLHHYKIYIQPINYPTVPVGTERLRLTPSALHTPQMINYLVQALVEIWKDLSLPQAA
ncbi:5-aminolevulinate synthase [Candidatus Paracaedimonas acanthamoebae]|nr:5-aminolevulinate synthase [Candidatus Paracaedimonas acanthamoebae]